MPRYDPLTRDERSERMSRVRNADTEPEMIVRRLVHGMGYRYRLHGRDLPGNPDLVFTPRCKVIFVHGCFWHQHGCRQYRMPKTRCRFWVPKLVRNKERDVIVRRALRRQGWRCLVVWECQLNRTAQLKERIRQFLEV
ncbi:MAG: DNA mismatch endonuclease Vsr [Planctomycetota bacterium]